VAAAAALLYWVSAVLTKHQHTPDTAYFNHLADAFLHGRIHLENPPGTHDLTAHNGRWYVPFPPLPALLMMPFVAVLGLGRFNTVLFSAVVGGVNVWLAQRLLIAVQARGIVDVGVRTRRWLTAMWALGTIQWYIATQGSVWFVAHTCAAMFVFGALINAVHRRPVVAAALLAVAAIARPSTAFLAPALFGLVVRGDAGANSSVRGLLAPGTRAKTLRTMRATVGPLLGAAALLLAYNRARFGSFTEFGYSSENVADRLAADLTTYGQFNGHFLAHNVWAMLLAGPEWLTDGWRISPNAEGMSLFLTTPALALAFRSRLQGLTAWLWLGIACTLIPLLTYYNTGWYQFGYRFAMDFLPVLLVLVAIGARDRITRGWQVLVVLGIAMNLWGVAWFN
jgi:hypothetical protein